MKNMGRGEGKCEHESMRQGMEERKGKIREQWGRREENGECQGENGER